MCERLSLTRSAETLLELVDFIQLSGAAQGRINLRGLIEASVIDLVSLAVLVVDDDGIKAMTPQDFGINVAGTCLSRLSGRLHSAF